MEQQLQQQYTIDELILANRKTLEAWRISTSQFELSLEKQKNAYLEIINTLRDEVNRLTALVPIQN